MTTLPFTRDNVLDIAAEYPRLGGVTAVRTPAGDPAWLVTSYHDVRELFSDPGLGRSHPNPAGAPRFSHDAIAGGPIGEYATEHADHARMRGLAVPLFSRRRIAVLRPRITEFAARLADELEAPADLHEQYSVRLPVEVICELLGVPGGQRQVFRAWADKCGGMADQAAATGALQDLLVCMGELIAHKRAHPADDALSELAADNGLDDGQLVFLATMLLFAGFETTVARIDLGALLLMTHPEQRGEKTSALVEEVLRYSAPSTGVIPRYAHAPLELHGQRIHPGELVLLGFEQANRDPEVFTEPHTFDAKRKRHPHIAFGHGLRSCIGASLARAELGIALRTLFAARPGIRPAVPIAELRIRDDALAGGLVSFPVTW